MADFKVPNLCGASEIFNAVQSKFDDIMNAATDGLELDASALTTILGTEVTSLTGELNGMLPELPALPDANLQAELTNLSSLTPGSFQHTAKLAALSSKFGSALSDGGYDLDTLVSLSADAIAGLGGDICSVVPNFTVPEAGGTAIERAAGVLQSSGDPLVEAAATLNKNDILWNEKTAVEKRIASFDIVGEKVPSVSIGAYTVGEKTRKIEISVNGDSTTMELTTAEDAAADGVRVNVVSSGEGFSRRVIRKGGKKSFDNYDPNWGI